MTTEGEVDDKARALAARLVRILFAAGEIDQFSIADRSLLGLSSAQAYRVTAAVHRARLHSFDPPAVHRRG